MIPNSEWPEVFTFSAYCCWILFNGVFSKSSVKPITPLSGVRISWLILARNSDLALFPKSASSLACNNAASIFFCSVISLVTPTSPVIFPCESRNGTFETKSQCFCPSLLTKVPSTSKIGCPAWRTNWSWSKARLASFSGYKSKSVWPIISDSEFFPENWTSLGLAKIFRPSIFFT